MSENTRRGFSIEFTEQSEIGFVDIYDTHICRLFVRRYKSIYFVKIINYSNKIPVLQKHLATVFSPTFKKKFTDLCADAFYRRIVELSIINKNLSLFHSILELSNGGYHLRYVIATLIRNMPKLRTDVVKYLKEKRMFKLMNYYSYIFLEENITSDSSFESIKLFAELSNYSFNTCMYGTVIEHNRSDVAKFIIAHYEQHAKNYSFGFYVSRMFALARNCGDLPNKIC